MPLLSFNQKHNKTSLTPLFGIIANSEFMEASRISNVLPSAHYLVLLNCGIGEDSRESLDCKEIKPVNLKWNQFWIFTGRTGAEATILWPRDAKSQLTGKDPDAGKDWRWEEKGTREDETVGWHHRLNAHEFEQTPWDGDGHGSLGCCSPWGLKESDMA